MAKVVCFGISWLGCSDFEVTIVTSWMSIYENTDSPKRAVKLLMKQGATEEQAIKAVRRSMRQLHKTVWL